MKNGRKRRPQQRLKWKVSFYKPIRRSHWYSLRKDCNWIVTSAKSYTHLRKLMKARYPENNMLSCMALLMTDHKNPTFHGFYVEAMEIMSEWSNRSKLNLDSLKKFLQ